MTPRSISIDEIRALRAERQRLQTIEDELATLTEETRQRLLAQMREHVAHLHGAHTLADLASADPGPCDECSRTTDRWHYGRLQLCLKCTVRRKANLERAQQMQTHAEQERAARG